MPVANFATFAGMGYPIVDTPQGYFPVTYDANLVKGDIIQLLLTNPGERVMMPQFGTPLRTLLFDPNDSFLATKARDMIISSIQTWEPRIVVDAISVTPGLSPGAAKPFLGAGDDLSQSYNVLAIQILFRFPNDIKTVQELVLQVPLQGGNSNGNNSA